MKPALLALALLGATPAVALDCMVPDPLTTFAQVQAAPERWVVLLGRLDLAPDHPIPDAMLYQEMGMPDLAPYLAPFTGAGLSAGGFDRRFAGTVTLQPVCYGPWCGGWPAAGEVLLFAQVQADGSHVVPLDPCGQHVFAPPSAAQIAALTACMAGGGC